MVLSEVSEELDTKPDPNHLVTHEVAKLHKSVLVVRQVAHLLELFDKMEVLEQRWTCK